MKDWFSPSSNDCIFELCVLVEAEYEVTVRYYIGSIATHYQWPAVTCIYIGYSIQARLPFDQGGGRQTSLPSLGQTLLPDSRRVIISAGDFVVGSIPRMVLRT